MTRGRNRRRHVLLNSICAALAATATISGFALTAKGGGPHLAPTTIQRAAACGAGRDEAGGSDPWGGCFPGPNNTGVPAGTTLSAYTGSDTLSGVITGKKLTGELVVSGSASISNSEIDGSIRTTGSGTLTLTNVTVIGQRSDETFINVNGSNITAVRINVYDGYGGFQCMGNCSLTDSWLHDPYIIGARHYDAILSNGMSGFEIKHNTVSCNNHAAQAGATGGCSADIGFFGDFGPIQNVNADRNLLITSSDSAGYCLIAGWGENGKSYANGTNLVYTNNVFQKGPNGRCGQFGPVDYYGGPNTWTGITWDDGTTLNP